MNGIGNIAGLIDGWIGSADPVYGYQIADYHRAWRIIRALHAAGFTDVVL